MCTFDLSCFSSKIQVMYLRYYSIFLTVLIITLGVFLYKGQPNSTTKCDSRAMVASRFLLTDLCLSTESRHTRHLSQPELIAPFQDAPGYLDHFPSSTFISASNLHSSFGNRDSILVQGRAKNVMNKYNPPLSPLNIRGDAEGREENN